MSADQLIPEEQARKIVLGSVVPLGEEKIPLKEAAGRVLSANLAAQRTQPPFDASAMDGYAVRQADIGSLPTELRLVGASRAGEPFQGQVGPSEAVRIFTGAVVPEGADSIIIQENTEQLADSIRVLSGVSKGKFIRPAGLDFKTGDELLKRGEKLSPNALALAASMNYPIVPVHRKPRVGLIATGDELVLPGENVGDGQIIASNTFGLAAAAENCGAEIRDLGIVGDTREALTQALDKAIEEACDLIVTTGGASVGDHDLVKPVATEYGFEFKITKIAMRPGKPFLFGMHTARGRSVRLVGLAGNPVSSLVAFNVFVRPLIQLLSGLEASASKMQTAVLGRDLPQNDERAEYMRAVLEQDVAGNLVVTPFEKQDSSMLASFVQADCLVYREVLAKAASAGDACNIVLL